MMIFLAVKENNPEVKIQVERLEKKAIRVTVIATCPLLHDHELKHLFIPYYSHLAEKTNLHIGSGLEGFLVKKITDMMQSPLDLQYDTATSQIKCALTLTPNTHTAV